MMLKGDEMETKLTSEDAADLIDCVHNAHNEGLMASERADELINKLAILEGEDTMVIDEDGTVKIIESENVSD
jgi:hypothetical protein